MNKSLAIVILLMSTMIAVDGCIRLRTNTPSVSNTSASTNGHMAHSSPTPSEGHSDLETKAEVTIRVEIWGLWWSDEQLESNFDADNPPPKKAYIQLDRWDASQPDSAHPDRVDIICHVENRTLEPVDLSLQAFADFKVASYKDIAHGAATQLAVDERLSQISWSDNQTVSKPVVDRLQPGEAREIRFKDFPLRSLIDTYFKPSAGDLWPWKLRISTTAKNSKGARVAYSEAIIDLIPGA